MYKNKLLSIFFKFLLFFFMWAAWNENSKMYVCPLSFGWAQSILAGPVEPNNQAAASLRQVPAGDCPSFAISSPLQILRL